MASDIQSVTVTVTLKDGSNKKAVHKFDLIYTKRPANNPFEVRCYLNFFLTNNRHAFIIMNIKKAVKRISSFHGNLQKVAG